MFDPASDPSDEVNGTRYMLKVKHVLKSTVSGPESLAPSRSELLFSDVVWEEGCIEQGKG